MKALMMNMPLMNSSLIAHANAYKSSRPLPDALVTLGTTTGNETGPEQHAWI
jgi:hypothetical protein